MKRKKLFAGCLAILLALLTVVAPIDGTKVEAATVTNKPNIYMDIQNEIGEKKLTKEDSKVIAKAFGYGQTDGIITVCKNNTSAKINWKKSAVPYNEVYETSVWIPELSRDKNGKLVIKKDQYGDVKTKGYTWAVWDGSKTKHSDGIDSTGNIFDIRDEKYYDNNKYYKSINNHMGMTSFVGMNDSSEGLGDTKKISVTDAYVVRIWYTNDGKGNIYTSKAGENNRKWGYTDYWFISETALETSVLQFEEEEDNTPAEQHIVELPENKTSLSSSEFVALLKENETKEIVIKSNNNVTFTFKKGTMKAVEGKDSYDFSTTVNTTYSADLPYYVTENNFVSQIDYNYSGKLPAKASIRFYVGTKYSGKTLYYSLLSEDKTYAEVQGVTVDSEGYIIVKQDHCSSYLVTIDNPETKYIAKKVKLSKNSVIYNGKAQTPAVEVLNGEGNVIPSDNYTISYKNNKNVGKATVTVKMTGNYKGTLTATFTIKPKSTKLVSFISKKKAFTVKWSKQAIQTTGYQLQYATNNNFKAAKTVFVPNTKTINKTVTSLKAKQTYYVRVRTYKVVNINGNNAKIYSDWSPVEKVVTK